MIEFQEYIDSVFADGKRTFFSTAGDAKENDISVAFTDFMDAHRDVLHILMNIHTENINIIDTLERFFAERYIPNTAHPSQSKLKDLESCLYSSLQVELAKYNLSHDSFCVKHTNDTALALIHAALYAAGIRDPKQTDELTQHIMQSRKNAFKEH